METHLGPLCCLYLSIGRARIHLGYSNIEEDIVSKQHFTAEEARSIGEALGIDWTKFDVEQYRMGLDVELEHGLVDPHTNVTDDDPIMTGKIALAHLNEFPDYYTRLEEMEREAEGN